MGVLPLLLFLPWFAILGALFCAFPRQPRSRARRGFDLASLLLAAACSAAAMYAGFRRAGLDVGAGPIWPQVLATLYAYAAFLAAMLLALWLRARWLRR